MAFSMNRRQFLSAAGTVGAAWALSAKAQDLPASDRVVVGVMGMSRGTAVAKTFANQPGVEIRYACDVDASRAAASAASITAIDGQEPEPIGDFRTILDDPEVDVLICAAPNHWHAPATMLACAAGKHVYVEKPCSHTAHEGELMTESARAHNRVVQVGTQRRSSTNVRAAMAMLHDGAIGRVISARSTYSSKRGSIGRGKPSDPPEGLDYALWQGPAPRVPYVDNRIHYNWHWFWHWGNGEFGNNGVHYVDLCRWGLGVDFPIHVTSCGGRYFFDDDQETPDTHSVSFEFDGGKVLTWQGHSCNKFGEDFVTFYGDAGTLSLTSNGDYTLYDADNNEVRTEKGTLGDAEHASNFLAAIRNNAPDALNCGIDDAYKSTLLCHLGNIAHRVGRSLRCDASNGHILNDDEAAALWSRAYEPGWEPSV